MNTVTFFEGNALAHQAVDVRRANRTGSLRRLAPPLLLFTVLVVQLSLRLLVIGRAYELEALRARALRNDTVLRTMHSRYAEEGGPAMIAERAGRELGLHSLPPQRMRTFAAEARG